jgi:hypothetical protein
LISILAGEQRNANINSLLGPRKASLNIPDLLLKAQEWIKHNPGISVRALLFLSTEIDVDKFNPEEIY